MPCDTIQTTRVKFAGNVDGVLLTRAMFALGIAANEFTHDKAREQIIIRTRTGLTQPTQAQIAKSYSAQVVEATARKMGWKLQKTGEFQYAVTKGGI